MTKSDLTRWVSVKKDLPYPDAEKVVNCFFDALSNALKNGQRIELRGFGSFSIKEYDGYLGRNPRTGESVSVPPKRLPAFKVGKDMRNALNE